MCTYFIPLRLFLETSKSFHRSSSVRNVFSNFSPFIAKITFAKAKYFATGLFETNMFRFRCFVNSALCFENKYREFVGKGSDTIECVVR